MKQNIKEKLIKAVQEFDGEFIWGVGSPIKPNLVTGKNHHLGEGKPKLQVEALLCDIYLKEKGLQWEKHEWEHNGVKNFYYTCINHSHGTPSVVFKWSG